jgi:hypothetical protein
MPAPSASKSARWALEFRGRGDIADTLDLILKIQDVIIDTTAWTANKQLLATDKTALYKLASLTYLPHDANMRGSYIVDPDPSVFFQSYYRRHVYPCLVIHHCHTRTQYHASSWS